MVHFFFRRLALLVLVALGSVTLTFALIHLIPGDPAQAMAGEGAQAADIEAVRTLLGLDRPLWRQYVAYLKEVASGGLGHSIRTTGPVGPLVAEALGRTGQLAAVSLLVATLIAIPAGCLGAARKGTWIDGAASVFSLTGISIPNFWLGPMLIMVFSVSLGITPLSGIGGPAHLILPSLTLGLGYAGLLSRMTRASVLDEIHAAHVTAARARGLSARAAFLQHALPNALIPVVAVMALELGSLLTGSIVTEEIFGWPGLGSLVLRSIRARDYPVVQACVLLFAVLYVGINFLADVVYAALDPRVRFRGAAS